MYKKIILAISLLFLLSNNDIEKVNAYTCPTNYYCHTPGGEGVITYCEPTYGLERNTTSRISWTCSYNSSTNDCNGSYTPPGRWINNSDIGTKGECVFVKSGLGGQFEVKSNGSFGCCDYGQQCTCVGQPACTPSCPSGTNPSGPGDQMSVNCSYNNSCGQPTCTSNSINCYCPVNLPPAPSVAYLVYTTGASETKYALSTNPANPTKVPLPSAVGTTVSIQTNAIVPPANTSNTGYRYVVDNVVTAPVEVDSASFLSALNFDFNKKILLSNNTYKSAIKSRVTSKCGTNWESSTWYDTYFKISAPPTFVSATPNAGLSGTLTDSDNGPSCSDNNPQTFTVKYNDPDGATDFSIVGFGFAKAGGDIHTEIMCLAKKDPSTGNWAFSASDAAEGYNSSSCSASGLSVSTSGNEITVSFSLEFRDSLGDGGGLKTLDRYFYAKDSAGLTVDWVKNGTWNIDFTPPAIVSNLTVKDQYRYNGTWSTTDTSGILNVYGQLGLLYSDYLVGTKTVADETTGVTVSLPVVGEYSPTKIFDVAISSRTESLKLGTPENPITNGTLRMKVTAADNACNSTNNAGTGGSVGSPWFVTKGGYVHSGGSLSSAVPLYTAASSTQELPNGPTYGWYQAPYVINYPWPKGQAQISTTYVTGKSAVGNIVSQPGYGNYIPSAVSGYSMVDTSGVYNKLVDRLKYVNAMLVRVVTPAGGVVSGSVSAYAGASQFVIMKYTQDISVSSGFACDRGALIMTTGSITVNPNITIASLSPQQGCIFMAGGNIIVEAGTHVSAADYPKYDRLDGMFIAGGSIQLKNVDTDPLIPMVDGLVVNGSLIALGGDRSLDWKRSLRLADNNLFPTFAVTYDLRYMYLARLFFGGENTAFVHEEGYKPY